MPKNPRDLTALVVDDTPLSQKMLVSMLKAFGVGAVAAANDGGEALAKLDAVKPDVILVDWEMSPMSGIDFVSRVRRTAGNPYRRIPIVMVTAYSDVTDVVTARDAGVDEYLVKPLTFDTVASHMKLAIEKRRQFIRSDSFVGPDRRRRSQPISGQDRRSPPVHIKLRRVPRQKV